MSQNVGNLCLFCGNEDEAVVELFQSNLQSVFGDVHIPERDVTPDVFPVLNSSGAFIIENVVLMAERRVSKSGGASQCFCSRSDPIQLVVQLPPAGLLERVVNQAGSIPGLVRIRLEEHENPRR